MKISVIIPTYNRVHYLGPTLDSVLDQTCSDFEIIVVDDGSTDQTQEWIKKNYPQVNYIFQENQERGAARNQGIREAKGQFIAFCDSDDLWNPKHLERSLEAMKNPSIALVYSGVIYIDEKNQHLFKVSHPKPKQNAFDQLLCNNFIPQSTVMVRKEVFEHCGTFDERRTLSGSEDWEMWIRILRHYDFDYVQDNFNYFRWHAGNETSSEPMKVEQSALEAIQTLSNNKDLKLSPSQIHKMRAKQYQIIGINYYSNGQMKKSRKWYAQSLQENPWNLISPQFGFQYIRTFLGKKLTQRIRRLKYQLKNQT